MMLLGVLYYPRYVSVGEVIIGTDGLNKDCNRSGS